METVRRKLFLLINKKSVYRNQEKTFRTKCGAIFHFENSFRTKCGAIFHFENSFRTKYEAHFPF